MGAGDGAERAAIMVDTRRMSLKGTGMGPVALRCRVSDINRTPDGHWDLSARMLEGATAGRVIVRVPDASRMHPGDSVIVKGRAHVGLDGILHIQAAEGGVRVAHTHDDDLPEHVEWAAA